MNGLSHTFPHFLYAVSFFLLAIMIDITYIVFKPTSWKKALKISRMGISLYLIVVYLSAYLGTTNYFIKSGKATVIGMSLLAASFIWDTIADWRVRL